MQAMHRKVRQGFETIKERLMFTKFWESTWLELEIHE
jgi:hypothetical protein